MPRTHSERLGGTRQIEVALYAWSHSLRERDVHNRRERDVVRDIHAFAPVPPRSHLLRSRPQGLRCLVFVLPAVEPERCLEQRPLAEPFLPAWLLSVQLTRVLLRVRDCPGIREGDSLDVLERDPQEGSDAHDLVKR